MTPAETIQWIDNVQARNACIQIIAPPDAPTWRVVWQWGGREQTVTMDAPYQGEDRGAFHSRFWREAWPDRRPEAAAAPTPPLPTRPGTAPIPVAEIVIDDAGCADDAALIALLRQHGVEEIMRAVTEVGLQPFQGWNLIRWRVLQGPGSYLFYRVSAPTDGVVTPEPRVLCINAAPEHRAAYAATLDAADAPTTLVMAPRGYVADDDTLAPGTPRTRRRR